MVEVCEYCNLWFEPVDRLEYHLHKREAVYSCLKIDWLGYACINRPKKPRNPKYKIPYGRFEDFPMGAEDPTGWVLYNTFEITHNDSPKKEKTRKVMVRIRARECPIHGLSVAATGILNQEELKVFEMALCFLNVLTRKERRRRFSTEVFASALSRVIARLRANGEARVTGPELAKFVAAEMDPDDRFESSVHFDHKQLMRYLKAYYNVARLESFFFLVDLGEIP
jgi:hypothetical protein